MYNLLSIIIPWEAEYRANLKTLRKHSQLGSIIETLTSLPINRLSSFADHLPSAMNFLMIFFYLEFLSEGRAIDKEKELIT